MIRVLLVDDHKIVRQGLRAILDTDDNIKVVGECENGEAALEFLDSYPVHVALMDIMMPIMNGIETTKIAKQKHPDLKVMVLSMQADYFYIQKMLEAGASGYALKSAGAGEICESVKMVYDGNTFFTKDITKSVMSSMAGDAPKIKKRKPAPSKDKLHLLTSRETEILKLIAMEMTNKEIGNKLLISSGTVSTHRRNLLQKIGVKNSIGLVRFAYNCGIIAP